MAGAFVAVVAVAVVLGLVTLVRATPPPARTVMFGWAGAPAVHVTVDDPGRRSYEWSTTAQQTWTRRVEVGTRVSLVVDHLSGDGGVYCGITVDGDLAVYDVDATTASCTTTIR